MASPPSSAAPPSHLLLDFFGTVVEYSPSRTTQRYQGTYELTTTMGSALGYDESTEAWSTAFEGFEASTAATLEEFSMHQVAHAALDAILGRPAAADEIQPAVEAYLTDWGQGIVYPAGMLDVLRDLSATHTLAIVSNTHDANLVQSHLSAMGVSELFATVVTSIDVGRRKPHPAIYAAALERLGIRPGEALFVGDSLGPDYTGPESVGIASFLIDPTSTATVPAPRRLASLGHLAGRLANIT
ncbi:HAD family hydrolase [Pengzhenrongella sp.]|jgi:putative hydrolase of the HAD superfamily|uniref:HAD family hydrolase n=1 Tax=Pengzhenrongella sp. TaxID=2888820 RepID=UPI002F927D75